MEKIKIEDNSGDKKYFTIIPNYIYNHSTLWDREVYCQMKRIAGDNGKCWISQKNLAKQCGISVNRLKKSLKYLLENNWIKEIGKKQNNKNDTEGTKIYEICDLWKKNNDFYKQQKAVSPDDIAFQKAVSPNTKGGITDEQKAVSPGAYKEEQGSKKNYEEDNTSNAIALVEEFSFEKELETLKQGKRKDFKIIALYWKKKNFVFTNKEQFNSALKRELRAAKSLIGYSGEQLARIMDYCKEKYPDLWTLETCVKRSAEVINKQ